MRLPVRAAVTFAVSLALGLASSGSSRAEEPEEDLMVHPSGVSPGFPIVQSDRGALTFRLTSYIRYLNQDRLDNTYVDAFGNVSVLDRRQDIHLNKMSIQFMGWVRDPRLRYLAYVWTSGTSQGQTSQVVVGGNLNFDLHEAVSLGGGIEALPGVRTTEGNYPFWLSMDNRSIADEFFRPSYTMGVWAAGRFFTKFRYKTMLGNNLSQFGVDAGQIDNGLNTFSTSLQWYPTTGEFGARHAFGDFEVHQRPATRLGVHYTRSDETAQGQPNTDAFENVQIRLSDGNVIFRPDLFGPGIQIRDALYQMTSVDAAVKFRGLSLEGEYYWRHINNLDGPGVSGLAFSTLEDDGFQLQTSMMAVPQSLMVYVTTSRVFGQYGEPFDTRLGLTWYLFQDRAVWWNFEYLYTKRSPVGASSLPYIVGGTGPTFYSNFVVHF